jgi:pantoate--beta-alanine ligase
MKILSDPRKINQLIRRAKRNGKSIGFVPTMGALHAGHLSLIRQAKRDNDLAVVSIFVNPAQFGPQEDLKRYPRPLKNDLALCRKEKVDLVFIPEDKMMYPEGFVTFVNVEGLSGRLCGAARPGHFRGVTTVVTKLLNIISADVLYLGQKDAQQAVIISRMVEDLNFAVKIVVMPIVRGNNGLALSSRNVYLSKSQREEAQVLFKALHLAKLMIRHGQFNSSRIIEKMKELISRKKQAKIDYVAIVDPKSLGPLKKIGRDCLVCLAVKFGKTRLIDNLRITCG